MQIRSLANALLLAGSWVSSLGGTTWYVAPSGDDHHSGLSSTRPFRTLTRAAAAMGPGDETVIAAGVYRETVELRRSGTPERPLTLRAAGDGPVVVDGSEQVRGQWLPDQGGIWRVPIEGDLQLEAVFVNGQMMVEARWPDCPWEENWNPHRKWALTDTGTVLGSIQSEALARSGVDLSGGLLYLKLSKGNSCFTRAVLDHAPGSAQFSYDTAGIEGRAWREDAMPERIQRHGLEGNRFFVVARGALDAPGEWFHDRKKGELLLKLPDGIHMADADVTIKRRTSGLIGNGVSDIIIDGLTLFACNVEFDHCQRLTLRNLDFLYPSTPRLFPDRDSFQALHSPIRVHGAFNRIESCRIRWAIDGGLVVEGVGNEVENCVFHDLNLHGRHPGPAISLNAMEEAFPETQAPNRIRHNTIFNVGSVGIYPSGNGPIEVAHNHVFNAGLHSVDISSLYVPIGRQLAGTRLHHNWLHDIHGIGFRVDIQGRDITFDHNLVWNAAAGGKLQGVHVNGFNNTIVVNNPAHPLMVVFEPEATQDDLNNWRVQNNVAYGFVDRKSLRGGYAEDDARSFRQPLSSRSGSIDHNVRIVPGDETSLFADPEQLDFRPRPGGPLDATGTAIDGFPRSAEAAPPSIGALEALQPFWKAGAHWLPDGLPVPASPLEATHLARSLRPPNHPVGTIDLRYSRQ